MNGVETAICYFNELLAKNSCLQKGKQFGKTELVEKGEQIIPVVVGAGFSKDCSPSDLNMPLTYWRVDNPVMIDDPEGYGEETTQTKVKLTLFFYASTRILKTCNAEQLDWAQLICSLLPSGLFQINTEIHSALLGDLEIDTDKAGILESELGGNEIAGRILDLLVFSISTELTFSFCGEIC